MSPEVLLLLALMATSTAIGLSLYAALAIPGILAYFGLIPLPDTLTGLSTPLVWLTLLGLLGIEVAACRFRLTDLVWNVIHTFARPLAAFLFVSAALAVAPANVQWWGAVGATAIALSVHMSVLAVRTARRTAGPSPAGGGFTGIQLSVAAVIATLAWTAPPFAASTAAILVLAPLPWAPRLWGSASMALSAFFHSITQTDRLHRWDSGTGRISRRLRRAVEEEYGTDFDTVRSAAVTLARMGPGWPYLRGRLLIASRQTPLFTHHRGLRSAVIRLTPAQGVADHGALVETLDMDSPTPYTLCLGPDAPSGPAILAALQTEPEPKRREPEAGGV